MTKEEILDTVRKKIRKLQIQLSLAALELEMTMEASEQARKFKTNEIQEIKSSLN